MGKHTYTVAVVGATGLVGRELVEILAERQFPLGELRLFASERSAGEYLECGGRRARVEILRPDGLGGTDLVFFATASQVSAQYVPTAVAAGAVVIDTSSHFRMEPDVPLVVPEVNAQEIGSYRTHGIIAGPNCAAIPLVVALKPLQDAASLRRVIVSTYQSVSGAGKAGIDELSRQTINLLNAREATVQEFPQQIAFNCIPHIDAFGADGYTGEERKIMEETRKILAVPHLPITVTAVRVPTFYGHCASLVIETERKLTTADTQRILREAPGIVLWDDPSQNLYPTSFAVTGTDATYVGRIREDTSFPCGLHLWVAADNVRKGAALNAVQIAEILIRDSV